MAFPKTQSGGDLMLEAPSEPEPEQYDELGLKFVGVKRGAAGPTASAAGEQSFAELSDAHARWGTFSHGPCSCG